LVPHTFRNQKKLKCFIILQLLAKKSEKNIERFLNNVQKGPFWGMPGPVWARFWQIWA